MNLTDEIRKSFAEVHDKSAIQITNVEEKFKSWVVRMNGWYGVGIPNVYNMEISERFSNVRIWNCVILIDGNERDVLLLTSDIEYLRYEFATVCAEFVLPGEEGDLREKILKDPVSWWDKWRTLLGNSVQNKMAYSVLGEMVIYKSLLENKKNIKWAALDKASNDLETENESYEVKSTVKRYDTVVTINSQHQLFRTQKKMFLCFCRFEESLTGKSIEDMLKELAILNCNYEQLSRALEKMGFEKGCTARNKKYKLLEARKYEVDNSFPKITKESFVNGIIPEGILKIVYDIELNSLKYHNLNLEF